MSLAILAQRLRGSIKQSRGKRVTEDDRDFGDNVLIVEPEFPATNGDGA